MSSEAVARWNAIPMSRDDDEKESMDVVGGAGIGSLKRPRSHSIGEEGYYKDDEDNSTEQPKGTWHVNEEEDDDDVSLISCSPSPVPPKEGEDVDMEDVYKYDEHVSGYAREVVTIETKIKSTNKGFGLLAKMGWVEGQPLGLSGDGRVDPIPFSIKNDMTGLGKMSQDYEMIESTVAQRRNLESERMRFETQDQRIAREASVAQKATIQSEISTTLRPFYCELCDKQFKNVAQYDEHTNSYAHHHKARMKDLQGNHPMRMASAADADARKEKERRREEKELRKMAKAMGVKMPSTSASGTSSAKSDAPPEQRKSGWTTVSSSSSTPALNNNPASSAPPTPPITSSSSSLTAGGNRGFANMARTSAWQTLSPTPPPPPPSIPATTTNSISPPPPPAPVSAWRTLPSEPPTPPIPAPAPSFKSSGSGWIDVQSSSTGPTELFPSGPPSTSQPATAPRRSGWAPVPQNVGGQQQQVSQRTTTTPSANPPRSGWSTIPSSAASASASSSQQGPMPMSTPMAVPLSPSIPGVPSSIASTTSLPSPAPASSSSSSVPAPTLGVAVAVPSSSKQATKKAQAAAAEESANKARGNWQNFKKGFGKR